MAPKWSVNSDHLGATGLNLDDLSYELGINFDPGVGTNFLTFDPVNQTNSDNSIGTEATAAGVSVASNGSNYASLIGNNSIAQNSWNMEFFDGGPFLFDANVVVSTIYTCRRPIRGENSHGSKFRLLSKQM